MELHFLGLTYFKFEKHIQTIASQVKARYRGQEYHPHVPVTINQSQMPDN